MVKKISIVIPCLNEEKSIESCIRDVKAFFEKQDYNNEILVVDNGSSDSSAQIAKSRGARVISEKTKGYGSALRKGIESAQGDFILMADGDGSYDLGSILPFIEKLEGGYDLVVGNRFLEPMEAGAMPLLNRYIGNPILSGLARILFSPECGDLHCGMRAFKKEPIKKLQCSTNGMEFASELIIKSKIAGLKITEVPIKFRKDKRNGRSNLRPFRDGLRHLSYMFYELISSLFKHYVALPFCSRSKSSN